MSAREARTVPPHKSALGHGLSLTARHGDTRPRADRLASPAWQANALRMGWACAEDFHHDLARDAENDTEEGESC